MDETERWVAVITTVSEAEASKPERICALCLPVLGVSGAGVTMVTQAGGRGVACATDPRAGLVEELQLRLGVGPGIDAIEVGTPVMLPDLSSPHEATAGRWSVFVDEAQRAGVRAVFAFPLRVGAVVLGALDLFRDRPGPLTEGAYAAGLMVAEAATMALLHTDIDSANAFRPNPSRGSDYLMQVHQATGMISVQLEVGLDEALVRLRARAFAAGRSMGDISDDVVARRLRFTAEDG